MQAPELQDLIAQIEVLMVLAKCRGWAYYKHHSAQAASVKQFYGGGRGGGRQGRHGG